MILTQPAQRPANVLDPAQLVRIEAVHRGFLFQHLYTVQCLLSAAALSVQTVAVESDEDVEVQFEGRRIYVQVKHRKVPLAWNDIEDALTRFGELRAAHARGERDVSRPCRLEAGIFRPSWINTGDPETLTTSNELAFEVGGLQAVLFSQQGERLPIQIARLSVCCGNTDAEYGFEREAGLQAAPLGAFDDQS
jgi:hypothetical protein